MNSIRDEARHMMNSNNIAQWRHNSFIMDGGNRVYNSNKQPLINEESTKIKKGWQEKNIQPSMSSPPRFEGNHSWKQIKVWGIKQWVRRKKVTSLLEAPPQESSSSKQTKALDQWTSQREVWFEERKTPNPHWKSQLGGEALPCIQVSILSLHFSF